MSTEGILRGISSREQRKIIRQLLKQGWTVNLTGGTHIKVTHPNGRSVTTAFTSSDHRGWRNFQAKVRQVEKEAGK